MTRRSVHLVKMTSDNTATVNAICIKRLISSSPREWTNEIPATVRTVFKYWFEYIIFLFCNWYALELDVRSFSINQPLNGRIMRTGGIEWRCYTNSSANTLASRYAVINNERTTKWKKKKIQQPTINSTTASDQTTNICIYRNVIPIADFMSTDCCICGCLPPIRIIAFNYNIECALLRSFAHFVILNGRSCHCVNIISRSWFFSVDFFFLFKIKIA